MDNSKRKDLLYDREAKLLSDLDALGDQTTSEQYKFKKQRLESIQQEFA
jgi:hypothetical protein